MKLSVKFSLRENIVKICISYRALDSTDARKFK